MSDHQQLALVYLHDNEQMVSVDYQRLNRVDPVMAGRDLRSLVQMGLVEQHGTRRLGLADRRQPLDFVLSGWHT